MGSKTRLSSYCSKRGDNIVNLVTSRKVNTRLARPILFITLCCRNGTHDTSDAVLGVMGLDFSISQFYSLIVETFPECGKNKTV